MKRLKATFIGCMFVTSILAPLQAAQAASVASPDEHTASMVRRCIYAGDWTVCITLPF